MVKWIAWLLISWAKQGLLVKVDESCRLWCPTSSWYNFSLSYYGLNLTRGQVGQRGRVWVLAKLDQEHGMLAKVGRVPSVGWNGPDITTCQIIATAQRMSYGLNCVKYVMFVTVRQTSSVVRNCLKYRSTCHNILAAGKISHYPFWLGKGRGK